MIRLSKHGLTALQATVACAFSEQIVVTDVLRRNVSPRLQARLLTVSHVNYFMLLKLSGLILQSNWQPSDLSIIVKRCKRCKLLWKCKTRSLRIDFLPLVLNGHLFTVSWIISLQSSNHATQTRDETIFTAAFLISARITLSHLFDSLFVESELFRF